MFAVIVNTIAIILGALIGLALKAGISAKLNDAMMKALGLCVIVIGIEGAVGRSNVLIMIIAIALGCIIGEVLKIDERVNIFTENLLSSLSRKKEKNSARDDEGNSSKVHEKTTAAKITEAFITSCLIMNVGAMVIVGSLDAGLSENFKMLYTKSMLDFISGIMLAATMGAGVLLSALFTFIFQGAIVLGAESIAPYLSELLISELSITGSVLILAIGLNMIGLTRFKVLNYIPALAAVPLGIAIIKLLGL